VVQIRGKLWDGNGPKYVTAAGDEVRLFNMDSLEGADDVIITEGEYDAMVLAQHLATSPVDRARRTSVVGLGAGRPGADRARLDASR
jgi:hypothetical protein